MLFFGWYVAQVADSLSGMAVAQANAQVAQASTEVAQSSSGVPGMIMGMVILAPLLLAVVLFLYKFWRFTWLRATRLREADVRLRRPNTDQFSELLGFPASHDLLAFYQNYPHLERLHFGLQNRTSEQKWWIAEFFPLHPIDIREHIAMHSALGFPLGQDGEGGLYVVSALGQVWCFTDASPEGKLRVAESITEFAGFAPVES